VLSLEELVEEEVRADQRARHRERARVGEQPVPVGEQPGR
jgi:hypothetical protein